MGRGDSAEQVLIDDVQRFGLDDSLVDPTRGPLALARALIEQLDAWELENDEPDAAKIGQILEEMRHIGGLREELSNALERFFHVSIADSSNWSSRSDYLTVELLQLARVFPGYSPLVARDPATFNFFHLMAEEGANVALCGRPIHDHFERGGSYSQIIRETVCGECRQKRLSAPAVREVPVERAQLTSLQRQQALHAADELRLFDEVIPERVIEQLHVSTLTGVALFNDLQYLFDRQIGSLVADQVESHYQNKIGATRKGDVDDVMAGWRELLTFHPGGDMPMEPGTRSDAFSRALFTSAGSASRLLPLQDGELHEAVSEAFALTWAESDFDDPYLYDRYQAHLSAKLCGGMLADIISKAGRELPLASLYTWDKHYDKELLKRHQAQDSVLRIGRVLYDKHGASGNDYEALKASLEILIKVAGEDLPRKYRTVRDLLKELQTSLILKQSSKGSWTLRKAS